MPYLLYRRKKESFPSVQHGADISQFGYLSEYFAALFLVFLIQIFVNQLNKQSGQGQVVSQRLAGMQTPSVDRFHNT